MVNAESVSNAAARPSFCPPHTHTHGSKDPHIW
jgi:hypothetical protein